jgi:hypothetical protein
MHRDDGGHGGRARCRRLPALAGLLAATALVVAACGDDDDATPATTVAAATATTTGGGGASGTTGAGVSSNFDKTAFCDAFMDANMAGAAAGDPDADPVAGATALLEPAKRAQATAPPELADELAHAVELLEQAVATKDGSLIEQADPAKSNEWAAANCGWTKVAVTAEDYHFTGVPDTLKAGDYAFDLTNKGKEFHVLVIVKRKDGVTDSFEQLLSDPSGEDKVETLLGVAAPPGVPSSGAVRLEPGEYLVLCPIPIGTTGETEGSGPPHFTAGMQQPLTVTA